MKEIHKHGAYNNAPHENSANLQYLNYSLSHMLRPNNEYTDLLFYQDIISIL